VDRQEGLSDSLDNEQRKTLEQIVDHRSGANIEWRHVRALLEALGTVTEEHNGKVRVTVGGVSEVFEPPRAKDVDQELLSDLRRMLAPHS
jgi:hypothetical protein